MRFLKISLFLFVALLGNNFTVNASHMMGADISYKSLGSNKYLITIKLYRDCRGIPISPPSSQVRCNGSNVSSFTPSEIAVRDITPTCAGGGKPCNPANTTSGKGVEEHVYTYTADFTTIRNNGCCNVEIGTGQCCRNGDITTGASSQDFWTTAFINICLTKQNSSPVFYSENRAFFKCNQPVYYNLAARDFIDNDSLVYEMTDPMQSWSSKTTWSGGMSASKPFSVYCKGSCTPAAPNAFPPSGFYLDRLTGMMIFTPSNCSESGVAAIRVTEYRKDSTGKYTKIGYVTRDCQSWIFNMSDNNVPLIEGPDNIYLPDSAESRFKYGTVDEVIIPPTGSPVLNDTVKLKMLVAPTKANDTTFKILDPKMKNQVGQFIWTPMGLSSSLPYLMVLEARDNACPYNAVTHKAINVFVRKKAELAWVEGMAYFDANKNCVKDSFEYGIAGALISGTSGINTSFRADSSGYFSGWLPAGSYTFRISGKFANNICTKSLTLVNGKKYSVNLGGMPSIHISGIVYSDTNKNCKYDSLEPGLKNQFVYTDPGDFSSCTDSNGKWQLKVPAGDYKLLFYPKRTYTIVKCPAKPYTISIYNDTIYKNKDIAIADTGNNLDLSVSLITSNRYRRGFNTLATLVVKNHGKAVSNATVWVKFSKKLKYVSSPSYLVKTDTTLKFSVPTLQADDEAMYKIVFKADTSTCKLNDTMTSYAWLDTTSLSKDVLKTNNSDNILIKIVASVDPNTKQEHNTNGYAWREGNKLRYFVQFQNTGTDTAVNITVIDTLHHALLGKTIEFMGASHSYNYVLNTNVLKVNFPNIYLPDTGTNKERSIGHFEFSIDINPLLNKEQKFYNQADIYFDFANAVRTNKQYTTYTSYVNTGQTNKTAYCSNDSIRIGFSSNFKFNSGNEFKVILSDPSGLFAKGTKVLDSLTSSSNSGNFKIAIPTGITEGNLYRLKVVSTNPSGSILDDGASNYFALFGGSMTKPTLTAKDSLYCGKDLVDLSITSSYKSFNIYDRKLLITSTDSINPQVKLFPGIHYLTVDAISNSCSISSDTLIIKSDSLPKVKLSSPSHVNLKVCGNDSVTLKVTGCNKFDLLGNALTYLSSHKASEIKVVIPATLDTRTVRGISDLGCTDTSNTLKFIRYSQPNVTLSISDPDYEICEGALITFTASGNASSYQLIKNDSAWMSPFTSSINSANIKTTDKIRLVGTDNNGCTNSTNPISIIVNPLPDLKFTCSDADLILCKNSTTSFSFSGANTYRLFKNNAFWVVPSSSPYSSSDLINNDELYIEGKSDKGCIVNSAKFKFKVVNPSTSLTLLNSGDICITDTLFFGFSGGISYDLFKNNTLIKTITSPNYASKGFSNNDILFAEGTDSFGCISASSSITLKLVTKPTIVLTNKDIDNTICKNENVVINLTGGKKYDLYKNSTLWKPNTGESVNFTDIDDKDEIYAIGFTNSGCNNTSNIIKFTVWPLPAKPVITKTGTILSSNYTFGNQWFEGINKITGATSQNYSPVKTAIYYVEHTDVHGCLSPLSSPYNYNSISNIKLRGLKIYPNPASDHLIIETGEPGKFAISLIDMTGKLIDEVSFIGNHFDWQIKPAKGLYNLKIVNEKAESENVVVEFK